MKANKLIWVGVVAVGMLVPSTSVVAAETDSKKVKHVLLLSIDGRHAVAFYSRAHGMEGANGSDPYCPNLEALSHSAINYVATASSMP
jgi:hypothetical protein